MRRFFLVILLTYPSHATAEDDPTAFFESKIRPLLAENCYSCHSHQAKKLKANLHLDSREGEIKGGDTGPALLPNHPEKSRLIEAINYQNPDLQMPPKAKLTDQQIADLTTWIKQGAPWGHATATPIATQPTFDLAKRKKEHWAWQPLQAQTPPAIKDTAWLRNDIDRFILAKLEASGLQHAGPADKNTLLRRLCFDLTGLPPTPEDLQNFLNDNSKSAYEKQIDRLLASPHFGEHWARHWLDLVRYSETMGHEFDFPIPNAWPYRDYLIRAYNDDLPYNQFLTEQIAGDLLPNPRRARDGTNQSLIATAFWFLGEDVQAPVDVRQHQADLMDNRIDVLGKSMLGLTIACARCHDHKFDAISTADYYALYAYAKGARYSQSPINDKEITPRIAQLKDLKEKIRQTTAQSWLDRWDAIQRIVTQIPPAQTYPTRENDIELLNVVATGISPSPGTPGEASGPGDRPRAGRVRAGANPPTSSPLAATDWKPDGSCFTLAPIADFTPGDPTRPIQNLTTTPTWHSALISKNLQGHLRSPTFTITKKFLHVRAAGHGARLNLILDNFVVIRDPIYGGLKKVLKSESPAWQTFDLSMWPNHQAYLEIADTTIPDPGGPASPADAWAALTHATLSDNPKPPPAAPLQELPGQPSEQLRTTIELWQTNKLATDENAPSRAHLLAAAIEKGWLDGQDNTLTQLITQYHEQEKSLPTPIYTLCAADADAGDEQIFIRGNPKTPGPKIPRRFLEALTPNPQSAIRNPQSPTSGRLDLAAKIANPTNPLTARVYVNRIWHHLFGPGIVPSTDNFGALGEKPSHPDLLDHLATQFLNQNGSTKRLIKQIVLSNTYQQSSTNPQSAIPNPQSLDPANRLLHHQNIKRLQAESIRDHLLSVSGRLDPKLFGPPIPTHLTPFMEGRGRPATSGPQDGAGRRSIYLEVRRNFLPPMLLTFDMPQSSNTMGKRTTSNVPAQALILMNDPFIHEQARLWARATLTRETTDRARLTKMYQQAYSRPPTDPELQILHTYLNNQQDETTWTNIAHALINTKEFIFIN